MKAVKTVVNILAVFCYLFILLFLIIAAPMVAGYKPVVVLSGSMTPTYEVHSVLYYKPASFQDINEGDVITFSVDEENTMVTHRVVTKNGMSQTFLTRGDNSPDGLTDQEKGLEPVAYSSVAGKAMEPYHLPYAGYFVNFAQKPYIIALVAVILIAKIVLSFFGGPKETPKEKEEEQKESPEPENL